MTRNIYIFSLPSEDPKTEIYRHRLRNGPAFIIMRKSRWPKASIGQTSAPIRRKGDWRNPKWEIPKIMEINNIRWHWYANDRHHIGSVLKSESCKGSSRFQISRFRSTLNLTLRLASRLWLCKSGGTTAAAYFFGGWNSPIIYLASFEGPCDLANLPKSNWLFALCDLRQFRVAFCGNWYESENHYRNPNPNSFCAKNLLGSENGKLAKQRKTFGERVKVLNPNPFTPHQKKRQCVM